MTCGNGKLDAGEACDDGNKVGNDGCDEKCQQETDWACPTPGQPCIPSTVCGDGGLSRAEQCDDANTNDGDGCNSNCELEDGWQCRVAGQKCVPLCGDGVMVGSEQCDDGNSVSGDGCSSTCMIEPGWTCEGTVCTQSVCGNGIKEAGESCDNGELNGLFFGDGTGCSKTCTAEPKCRDDAGNTTACTTHCGDGHIDPDEQCDDGNAVSGDGCDANCQEEPGFMCTTETKPDTQPCVSGAGECLILPVIYRDFDGQHEPTGHPDFFFMGATVNGRKTVCVPNASGKTVALTTNCANTDSTDLCTGLVEPTLGPDGKPVLAAGGSMCDCRFTDWDQTGILTGVAAGGNSRVEECFVEGANEWRTRIITQVPVIASADSFKQWFNDSDKSTKVTGTLELQPLVGTTNQFQFSSSNGRTVYDDLHDLFLQQPNVDAPVPANAVTALVSGFFPLEDQPRSKLCNIWPYWATGLATNCSAGANSPVGSQWDPRGWYGGGAAPAEPTGGPVESVTGMMRNFYFTSEARYLFRYAGNETLAFYGDDDVWVFVNGKLVLDLGAPHERLQGRVQLTDTGAQWVIESQDLVAGTWDQIAMGNVPNLGLEVGKTYEIVVFHADRHPRESNYQLTLSGFATTRSVCQPRCGDGIVTATEECDLGDGQNQDGLYNGCTTNCTFGPFCGDGVHDAEFEECDLGRENRARPYEPSPDGCTPACKKPRYCGDGVVDTDFGERCDDGPMNGMGNCQPNCQPRTE